MMGNPIINRSDSRQLEELRAKYNRYKQGTDPRAYWHRTDRATPYRLGIYSALMRIEIDDYGAHSKRWIDLFQRGVADCRSNVLPALRNSQGLT